MPGMWSSLARTWDNNQGWKRGPLTCWVHHVNSLVPGRFDSNFMSANFKLILMIDGCFEIALRQMSLDLSDEKSTLVQVMAWSCQAINHYYLSQCWHRSKARYGVPMLRWVKASIKLASILLMAFSNERNLIKIFPCGLIDNCLVVLRFKSSYLFFQTPPWDGCELKMAWLCWVG